MSRLDFFQIGPRSQRHSCLCRWYGSYYPPRYSYRYAPPYPYYSYPPYGYAPILPAPAPDATYDRGYSEGYMRGYEEAQKAISRSLDLEKTPGDEQDRSGAEVNQ